MMKLSLALALCLSTLVLATAKPNQVSSKVSAHEIPTRMQDLSPLMRAEIASLFREAIASKTDLEIAQFLDSLDGEALGEADCNQDGNQITCSVSFSFTVPFVGRFSPTVSFIGEYLSEEIGFRVQVTVDGRTIIDKTVSVENPPAICAKVPWIPGKILQVCLKASDLSFSNGFHGCFALSAKALSVTVLNIDLGCFDI